MRRFILAIILFLLASFPVMGQEPIYLPLILKANIVAPQPILRVRTNDGKIIDLLEDWEISDPYWRPQIAQYKGDGDYVDSAIADGRRLVSKKYANVVETIPLTVRGTNQAQAINRIRELLQVIRQAANYWTEPYEYDYAWLEVRPACNDCRTGYAKIVKANVPELNDPYGQPFFSAYNEAVMEDISLIVERQPLWRGVQPGTIIGPLYNLVKNPDFELWNFGIADSQPDNWNDLELGITGTNNREDDNHSGNYSLKVRVSQSLATNRFKGVSQVIASTRANATYTVVAWVRNDGVSRGVGRILVTYSSQLEIYRDSVKHGWQLYTGTFTTGATDIVAINLEILTTASNTDGTVYFDSVMILEGDWEQEAIENMLPYMTSSHVVNHWDQAGSTLIEAGDINYVDMWDIPGDESALVKLEMVNNTPDSGVNSPVVFQTIRAGMRRARDVEEFTNFYDPSGVGDTTASGDDRVNSGTLSTLWTTVGFFTINDPNIIQDNLGRFRVLARVWDTSTSGAFNLEVRLRYWVGQSGINVKELDSVIVPGRGSWYIMDLTGNAAMNWDVKTKNLPGSLGFEIQMRRASGETQGRLDYAMILPTDGGVLFANVSPSVPLNSGLVVDNTNSSDVYGARLPRGWREVYQTPISQNVLKNFNGALYFGTEDSKLYKFQNNGGTLLHDYGTGFFIPLEVYNNRLFIATRPSAGVPGQAYSTDGTTFPGTAEFTFGGNNANPLGMRALQGYLYIVGETSSVSKLWRWDGSAGTATEILTGGATYSEFSRFGIYKNKLYIHGNRTGSNNIDIIEYDPATGLSSVSLTINGGAVQLQYIDFVEFNGSLYWLTGAALDFIYRFDGSVWTQVEPLDTVSGTGILWHAGIVAGNKLYISATVDLTVDKTRVMSTEDGITWTTEYLPDETGSGGGIVMTTSQGQIFMGVAGNPPVLHATTFLENQYKVADYQLSEFKAPNREWGNPHRHRYFFSYDRENGVNVQDDAMLIGVGVVPQYLSLVGAN